MARPPRIDYAGAWHHVMNRGARREPIFREETDYWLLLDCLSRASEQFELEVHAYALMPNHYHALVRSRHGNLSAAMKEFGAAFTQRLNLPANWDGPVFRGRFQSELIRDETCLPYILAYVHLAPLRGDLVSRIDSRQAWTSHRAYTSRALAFDWIEKEYFLDLFGSARALQSHILDLHRGREPWPKRMAMDTGFFGFRHSSEAAENRASQKRKSKKMSAAEAIEAVKSIAGVDEQDLKRVEHGPRANPARRFAVWALRTQTMMTHKAIARELGMSENQVANVLRRLNPKKTPMSEWIAAWRKKII